MRFAPSVAVRPSFASDSLDQIAIYNQIMLIGRMPLNKIQIQIHFETIKQMQGDILHKIVIGKQTTADSEIN